MALACQQKLWGRAVLWSPSKWVGSELGQGMLVPAEQGAEREGGLRQGGGGGVWV